MLDVPTQESPPHIPQMSKIAARHYEATLTSRGNQSTGIGSPG
jgi:hypothetical protein